MVLESLLLVWMWIFFIGGFLFIQRPALDQRKDGESFQEQTGQASWPYERRRYKRRYLPFPVDYASFEEADSQETTLTDDVGKGGLRIPVRCPLRKGSLLYLSIDVPRDASLSLFGEVVWQSPRASLPSRFDTGIKFTNLSPTLLPKLSRHLKV